jgi:hypothetical protein
MIVTLFVQQPTKSHPLCPCCHICTEFLLSCHRCQVFSFSYHHFRCHCCHHADSVSQHIPCCPTIPLISVRCHECSEYEVPQRCVEIKAMRASPCFLLTPFCISDHMASSAICTATTPPLFLAFPLHPHSFASPVCFFLLFALPTAAHFTASSTTTRLLSQCLPPLPSPHLPHLTAQYTMATAAAATTTTAAAAVFLCPLFSHISRQCIPQSFSSSPVQPTCYTCGLCPLVPLHTILPLLPELPSQCPHWITHPVRQPPPLPAFHHFPCPPFGLQHCPALH